MFLVERGGTLSHFVPWFFSRAWFFVFQGKRGDGLLEIPENAAHSSHARIARRTVAAGTRESLLLYPVEQ